MISSERASERPASPEVEIALISEEFESLKLDDCLPLDEGCSQKIL